MKNDYCSKWMLFITSYLPLYLWLIFSNFNYNNDFFKGLKQYWIFFGVLFILVCLSIYEIRQLFVGSGSENETLPKDMEVSPESDSLMNYVITYFTPLISFNLAETQTVIMNVLLFCLIGLMYVGSSATYLNPVLGIFGFKIFGVSNFPNAHHIISKFSFDELETIRKRGDNIVRYRIGDGIFVIRPIKNKRK
ncbi:hypothetical protein [uncultured Streptococcus sp.]|uniref:hypothetical protein n=1 Tax=uncultured Streptococcus sp. TaxID=83427 RepID=UPI002595CB3B|nr:hypothetical protein [uncultured Streptococcus sp.]